MSVMCVLLDPALLSLRPGNLCGAKP